MAGTAAIDTASPSQDDAGRIAGAGLRPQYLGIRRSRRPPRRPQTAGHHSPLGRRRPPTGGGAQGDWAGSSGAGACGGGDGHGVTLLYSTHPSRLTISAWRVRLSPELNFRVRCHGWNPAFLMLTATFPSFAVTVEGVLPTNSSSISISAALGSDVMVNRGFAALSLGFGSPVGGWLMAFCLD
jgi:hypothetical protein